jgi:hypothetical protein
MLLGVLGALAILYGSVAAIVADAAEDAGRLLDRGAARLRDAALPARLERPPSAR